jgi:hypothetical protein
MPYRSQHHPTSSNHMACMRGVCVLVLPVRVHIAKWCVHTSSVDRRQWTRDSRVNKRLATDYRTSTTHDIMLSRWPQRCICPWRFAARQSLASWYLLHRVITSYALGRAHLHAHNQPPSVQLLSITDWCELHSLFSSTGQTSQERIY